MWIERRMTDGPRQTKADAASCPQKNDRRGSARSADVRNSCDHRRARRPPGFIEPSGHHLHSGVDVIHHPNVRRGPDQERRAVGEQRSNEPKPVAPRPSGRSTTNVADHRGAFLTTTDPLVGLRPRSGGGTPRAIARIEVRAIDSAMWLERCCCRQRPHRIPAPALVEARSSNRGSSCRRARCLFDHRTWRAAEERSVRNHRLQATHAEGGLRVNQRQH